MKRIALIVLALAVTASAATKQDLIDRLSASASYAAVGTPFPMRVDKIALKGGATKYKVSALLVSDTTAVRIRTYTMYVTDEGTGSEAAYWEGRDPLVEIVTVPTPEMDTLRSWIWNMNGFVNEENPVKEFILGSIMRPITGQPDSVQQIDVVVTWTGSSVVWKKVLK